MYMMWYIYLHIGHSKVTTILCLHIYVGRPESRRIYQDGRANVTTVELSLDESKIHLKFCVIRDCKTKGEALNRHCICCLTKAEIPCFPSLKICHANCPPIKSK
jgi:hypothetical protein